MASATSLNKMEDASGTIVLNSIRILSDGNILAAIILQIFFTYLNRKQIGTLKKLRYWMLRV